MANTEHIRLIKRGLEAWNAWRDANPDIAPDLHGAVLRGADFRRADLRRADLREAGLSEADLSEADLSAANLRRADLLEANLSGTNLSGANLRGSDLRGANLSGADLREADLSGANLRRADLREANLSRANLSGADFYRANLSNANLSRANVSQALIWGTIFGDIDMSTIKGLETVIHIGPSTLGTDTLFKSDGKIPELFLRGVGLPEGLITYLPSLIARPIEFYSCFISYSHSDKSFARRLHDTLQGRGIRCWLDEHELLPGDKIYTEVDRGIRLWDKVLLCCSKDSLTSWWVDNEIKIAFDNEQQLWRQRGKEVLSLIPIDLDGYLFSHWQSGLGTEVKARLAANFGGWEQDNQKFEEQFDRLVRALRTDSRGKEPPPLKLL